MLESTVEGSHENVIATQVTTKYVALLFTWKPCPWTICNCSWIFRSSSCCRWIFSSIIRVLCSSWSFKCFMAPNCAVNWKMGCRSRKYNKCLKYKIGPFRHSAYPVRKTSLLIWGSKDKKKKHPSPAWRRESCITACWSHVSLSPGIGKLQLLPMCLSGPKYSMTL